MLNKVKYIFLNDIHNINFSNYDFVLLGEDIEEYFEADTLNDFNEQNTVHHNHMEEDTRNQICRTLYNTI